MAWQNSSPQEQREIVRYMYMIPALTEQVTSGLCLQRVRAGASRMTSRGEDHSGAVQLKYLSKLNRFTPVKG